MKIAKNLLIPFFIALLAFSFIIPSNADASTSGQLPIRPDKKGEWDSVSLLTHQGGDISLRLKYNGVHAGQKAYILWELSNMDTGKVVRQLWYNGDADTTHTFTAIPAGSYTLSWESQNNNKVEGWYSVTIKGGTVVR